MEAWKWFIWKAMSPAQILIGRKVRFSACKWECKRNNPLKKQSWDLYQRPDVVSEVGSVTSGNSDSRLDTEMT